MRPLDPGARVSLSEPSIDPEGDGETCFRANFLHINFIAPTGEAPLSVAEGAQSSGAVAGVMVELDGWHILVVEDSPLVAEVITAVLKESGCAVVGPVARLEPALGLAREAVLDAALLDLNLDGELSTPVAAELSARNIPFMFLTGYEAETLPTEYRARPRLTKPFHAEELIEALAKLMNHRSAVSGDQ